jgi:general stress protein YciG
MNRHSRDLTKSHLVVTHFLAEVLLVTVRPSLHRQQRRRGVTLEELQIQPIRLRLRSPLRQHPVTKPPLNQSLARTHGYVTGGRTDGHRFSTRAEGRRGGRTHAPRGEEREDVERAEEAGRDGLAQELPERGRVVRETEVGDEDPGQLGARALFGDDAGQLHRPQQRRVAARLRRLHRLHHPTLQVRGDQPRRIRRRHGGVLAGGLGFYFSFSIPVTFPLSLAVWPATRIGFV